ncbi:cytosolic endo-beta-N-acetylglucosaminidase 1-like isoform X2 [Triticum dicoccoides]|uniref:cytosolic endo-beta-N-acetylglucosaminidase 1-like isoform X2 n=1 Tax=Triticum dicoccoides TaxID=85692 RepID=UPI00188F5604|nr:cytosolic endo-beta-N-acetylglucosaminidase 1-like isoform X2 [Triticum dicoccoides]
MPNQGHGYQVSSKGQQVSGDPWNNIPCQSFQPMLKYTGDGVQPPVQTSINFRDKPYSGGDCVTVQGSLGQNAIFSEQKKKKKKMEDFPSVFVLKKWRTFHARWICTSLFLGWVQVN